MRSQLNKTNIEEVTKKFTTNDHFKHIALPRLLAIYAIKKTLRNVTDIKWFFEYNFTNTNNNRVILEFQHNKQDDLTLFYEIPLTQKFELRVYLGISSAHFLDIYNFLINKNIITENQFTLKAQYHTIPHFILNTKFKYNIGILQQITINSDLSENIDTTIQEDIKNGLEQFNPIFKYIANTFLP